MVDDIVIERQGYIAYEFNESFLIYWIDPFDSESIHKLIVNESFNLIENAND